MRYRIVCLEDESEGEEEEEDEQAEAGGRRRRLQRPAKQPGELALVTGSFMRSFPWRGGAPSATLSLACTLL